MKKCMILMGRYGGQVLTLDDGIAAGGIADGWAIDLAGQPYPFPVTILPSADRPLSLRLFENKVMLGGISTQPLSSSPIISATKAKPCVITVAAGEAPKYVSAPGVYINGTGNSALDNITFGHITVSGTQITLIGYNNPTAVANKGTVARAEIAPNPGIEPLPFHSLIYDPDPERKRT